MHQITIFRLLLVVIIAVLGCGSMQNIATETMIERIRIFSYFQEKGFTTTGALTHFDELKSNEIKLIEIAESDKEEIEKIILNAKKGKHRQTKLGVRHLFALIKFTSFENESKAILNIGSERVFIVNLSQMNQYEVTEPNHVKWLRGFSKRLSE